MLLLINQRPDQNSKLQLKIDHYKAKIAMRPTRPAPTIWAELAWAAPGVGEDEAPDPEGDPETAPELVAAGEPEPEGEPEAAAPIQNVRSSYLRLDSSTYRWKQRR